VRPEPCSVRPEPCSVRPELCLTPALGVFLLKRVFLKSVGVGTKTKIEETILYVDHPATGKSMVKCSFLQRAKSHMRLAMVYCNAAEQRGTPPRILTS
jgi:hypothetical protein